MADATYSAEIELMKIIITCSCVRFKLTIERVPDEGDKAAIVSIVKAHQSVCDGRLSAQMIGRMRDEEEAEIAGSIN